MHVDIGDNRRVRLVPIVFHIARMMKSFSQHEKNNDSKASYFSSSNLFLNERKHSQYIHIVLFAKIIKRNRDHIYSLQS